MNQFFHGSAKRAQFPNFGRMVAQMIADAGKGPIEMRMCFQRHKPMGNLANNVSSSVTDKFLTLDSRQQTGAVWFPADMGFEMIDERVRIDKYRVSPNKVSKRHDSPAGGGYSRSGLMAK